MSATTGIEWTDATWNPIRGCSLVSAGCENCYAMGVAARFSGPGQAYEGLARRRSNGRAQWTGAVRLVEKHLDDPIRWKTPRRIFVNSMSDLFHEKLLDEEIAQVFAVMALAQRHTMQVLTKRPARMRQLIGSDSFRELVDMFMDDVISRFVDLLGPVDLSAYMGRAPNITGERIDRYSDIDWVIVGGESGQNARPMHPDWAVHLASECEEVGVPFFFQAVGRVVSRQRSLGDVEQIDPRLRR